MILTWSLIDVDVVGALGLRATKRFYSARDPCTWPTPLENTDYLTEVKIKGEANAIFLELYYIGQTHPLKLLTILDLGTTLYIFNNLSCFYNFRKALRYKYITTGSLEVPILGYSDITI